MSEPDFEPDYSVVLQEETTPDPSVLVHTRTPVRTQELPRVAGATFSIPALAARAAQNPQRLLRADHRRAKATIMSIDTYIWIAYSQASAQDNSRMILWPNNVAFTVTADTEVWVLADTGTTRVGVATEMWAAGD